MSTKLAADGELMRRWSDGDPEALDQLIALAYGELQQLAHNHLRSERQNHTLQTTALINEAYMRMKKRHEVFGKTREQFFAIASAAMRQVLVDYARKRLAAKRGYGMPTIALGNAVEEPDSRSLELEDVLALDEALTRLQSCAGELSQLVEMKYFSGLSNSEISFALNISNATVKRRWSEARLWLARELAPARQDPVS